MSAQNVELVRRIYEAVTRRDTKTPFEIYAEDVVWDMSGMAQSVLMGTAVFHGHEGIRESWTDVLAAFGAVDFTIEEPIDLGDRVLVTVHSRNVGRSSGVAVGADHYALWTLADGRVTRLETFDDREDAERAAGLPP